MHTKTSYYGSMKRNVVLIVVVLALVGVILYLQRQQTQQKQQQQITTQINESPGTPWVQKLTKRYPYSVQTRIGVTPSQGDVNRAWVFGNIVAMDEQKIIVAVGSNADLPIKLREQTKFVQFDNSKEQGSKFSILKREDFRVGEKVFIEVVPDSKEADAYAVQVQKND